MKDDLTSMANHEANGTLREWFAGTAPILDIDGQVYAEPTFDKNGHLTGYKLKKNLEKIS